MSWEKYQKIRERAENADEYADKVASEIVDMLNTASSVDDAGYIIATRSHRTLQQNFMRVVAAFIQAEAAAYEAGAYDDRNAATAEICARLWEVLRETQYYLPVSDKILLPFI